MGIDPQRHVHCAVSCQVLNFFDVQTGLKHAGYIRVPQDVGGDVSVGKFLLDVPPRRDLSRIFSPLQKFMWEQFASGGMCANAAIHDTDVHNSHAHILLTMWPLNEQSK